LSERLLALAHQNLERGENLYQLLQAMGRFIPLLPAVPNVGSSLSQMRSGQLQARENIRRKFLADVKTFVDTFLTEQLPEGKAEEIWNKASQGINAAFLQFNVEGLSVQAVKNQQGRFRQQVDTALRDMLLESLSALDAEQLVDALSNHVHRQQEAWRKQIGEEEYRNFERLLLLGAIDREWRDYLTAMDDLRREISLEAI